MTSAILGLGCCTRGDEPEAAQSVDTGIGSGSGSGSASSTENDGEYVVVDAAPIGLLACSNDTRSSFLKDENRGVDVSACVVLDRADSPLAVRDAHIRILLRGEWVTPPEVAKEVELSPWSVGAEIAVRDAVAVERWELSFAAENGVLHKLVTDSGAYDWTRSAAFGAFVELSRSLAGVFGSAGEFASALDGELRRKIAAQTPFQLAFLSASGVRGDVGLDQADAICGEEGAALLPGKTWRALLSTSAAHARDRIPITADRIYNYDGNVVDSERRFWNGSEHFDGAISYLADGSSFHVPLKGTDPPEFTRFAWTGSKADGTYDPDLSCGDWTSSAPERIGRVGDVGGFAMLLESVSWPCSRRARLVCMSLP